MSRSRKQRRKQRDISKRAAHASLSLRVANGFRLFIKQQVRYMVAFVGIAWLSQLYLFPHYPDVLFFGAIGGALLGLSMKGRLWR